LDFLKFLFLCHLLSAYRCLASLECCLLVFSVSYHLSVDLCFAISFYLCFSVSLYRSVSLFFSSVFFFNLCYFFRIFICCFSESLFLFFFILSISVRCFSRFLLLCLLLSPSVSFSSYCFSPLFPLISLFLFFSVCFSFLLFFSFSLCLVFFDSLHISSLLVCSSYLLKVYL